MASLSVRYILDRSDEKDTKGSNSALAHALVSVLSGSINPLLMTDTEEAEEKPVVFAQAATS